MEPQPQGAGNQEKAETRLPLHLTTQVGQKQHRQTAHGQRKQQRDINCHEGDGNEYNGKTDGQHGIYRRSRDDDGELTIHVVRAVFLIHS